MDGWIDGWMDSQIDKNNCSLKDVIQIMEKSESEKKLGPFSQSVQFIIVSVQFLPSSLECINLEGRLICLFIAITLTQRTGPGTQQVLDRYHWHRQTMMMMIMINV